MTPIPRRTLLRNAAAAAAGLFFPAPLAACGRELARRRDPERSRLTTWSGILRAEGLTGPEQSLGRSAIRVGELARGTPYKASTLDAYLLSGGTPSDEPLTLRLTQFDCVTLVEACLAIARLTGEEESPTWDGFGREIERVRYRGGQRRGYVSRLHYFSEWIADGQSRGLMRDLGPELGGMEDRRPLRFMTEHRGKYPALADHHVFQGIRAVERRLDSSPRWVIPAKQIPQIVSRIETGDVLAFATEIPGLDVTHSAFAYRDREAVLRVLHAPLSGGVVEITETTVPEYVAGIRRATGLLVARPLRG